MKKLFFIVVFVMLAAFVQAQITDVVFYKCDNVSNALGRSIKANSFIFVSDSNAWFRTTTDYGALASLAQIFSDGNYEREVPSSSITRDLACTDNVTVTRKLTAADLEATDDVLLSNGSVVGITGNEVITFNAAGSINFTGATVDIDGAFTSSSMASDAGVSGTAITGSAEANFTNNSAAVTFGAVGTDADVVLAFDAVTNQGSLTYMEDEDRFDFDNDVDVVADLTAGSVTSDGAMNAASGMDLGTSQALVGTTAITIGSGSATTAVTSSDWAINATGVMTGIGAITSDGTIDPTIATTAAGGETGLNLQLSHGTNALTGELVGVRGNARVNYDSPSGTVMGGKFQAGNMDAGYDLTTATGVYVDVVNKVPVGATAWTNARGYEVSMDLNQGTAGNVNTITNAQMFYGVYNLPTVDNYATVTNGYGVFIRNEAVGGTGQMLDAGFYLDDLNHSGGIKGWDYGIDFSGIGSNSGSFGSADIRLSNGETMSNSLDKNIVINANFITQCPSPNAINSTDNITAAQMLGGIITSTSGAATSLTTPTATAIMALIPGGGQGTQFELIIDNSGGSNTVTLVLDGSIAVVTPAITGGDALTVSTANAVGLFRFYFTSSTAAKVFRIY